MCFYERVGERKKEREKERELYLLLYAHVYMLITPKITFLNVFQKYFDMMIPVYTWVLMISSKNMK